MEFPAVSHETPGYEEQFVENTARKLLFYLNIELIRNIEICLNENPSEPAVWRQDPQECLNDSLHSFPVDDNSEVIVLTAGDTMKRLVAAALDQQNMFTNIHVSWQEKILTKAISILRRRLATNQLLLNAIIKVFDLMSTLDAKYTVIGDKVPTYKKEILLNTTMIEFLENQKRVISV